MIIDPREPLAVAVVEAIHAGDQERLARLLAEQPGLATARLDDDRPGGTATVLESPDHGPELCLGAVADSYPPQCGGLAIPNWRWDQVEGEKSRIGTTWGDYQLVGTYDGASFTVIEADRAAPVPPPSAAEQFEDAPRTPCPEPGGGRPVPDPANPSEVQNLVHLEVVALDEQARQAIQDRFGDGAVRATALLTPLPGP